jgi:adenylate kinase
MNKVIAVFGISGVGKSRLISDFARERQGVLHVTASALIREETQVSSSDDLRRNSADKVHENQSLLVNAFKRLLTKQSGQTIIFDGHTVIDSETGLVIVPASIVASLGPSTLIFIEAPVESIYYQRIKDDTRKRPLRSTAQLSELQTKAKQIFFEYAQMLCLPYHVISSGDHRTRRS